MEESKSSQVQPELIKLGKRLKALRCSHKWTLAGLNRLTDISEAYLSRLESGERQPSLATLFKLADVYEVPLSELFRSSTRTQSYSPPSDIIVRAGERALREGNELLCATLSDNNTLTAMHPLRIVIPADRKDTQLYRHDGEEWLYVLSGRVILGNFLQRSYRQSRLNENIPFGQERMAF